MIAGSDDAEAPRWLDEQCRARWHGAVPAISSRCAAG